MRRQATGSAHGAAHCAGQLSLRSRSSRNWRGRTREAGGRRQPSLRVWRSVGGGAPTRGRGSRVPASASLRIFH